MRKEIIREAIYVLALAAMFLFCCAIPGHATTKYCDFATGDDGAGDGTAGNPYLTIYTASSGLGGGDEVRVGKLTPSATTGNLTFTNGSTSVTTASDETGNISAGDYVSLAGTGLVSSFGDESWWRVASLTSGTITLSYEYWGPGTAVAAQGYYVTPTVLAGDIDFRVNGTSTTDRMKISGGWDLGTETQDGASYLTNYGLAFDIFNTNSHYYFELSNFVWCISTSYAYTGGGTTYGSLFKDLVFINQRMDGFYGSSFAWNLFENIIQSGGPYQGFYFTGKKYTFADGLISYSAGTSSGDYGFEIGIDARNVILHDVAVYNAYDTALRVQGAAHIWISDLVLDTTTNTSSDGIYLYDVHGLYINGVDISNTVDDGIVVANECNDIHIHNPTFTNLGDIEVNAYASANNAIRHKKLVTTKHGGTPGDDRIYFATYTVPPAVIYRDTAGARSGTCLKFECTDVNDSIDYKVGTFKVTDGASNVTLNVYMKDDADFNGYVALFAVVNGGATAAPTLKTMTTSYVEQSITVDAADIATDDYVHLWVSVSGDDGFVYVDDFSASN